MQVILHQLTMWPLPSELRLTSEIGHTREIGLSIYIEVPPHCSTPCVCVLVANVNGRLLVCERAGFLDCVIVSCWFFFLIIMCSCVFL